MWVCTVCSALTKELEHARAEMGRLRAAATAGLPSDQAEAKSRVRFRWLQEFGGLLFCFLLVLEGVFLEYHWSTLWVMPFAR